MAARSLDTEFHNYWELLTPAQKESLLQVIKSFVIPPERISIEQYNDELDSALKRVEAGEYLTQDDVERIGHSVH